jgi:hypothetical protein
MSKNPKDLMSDAINKGQIKSISALDIAILKDLGMPVNNINPLTNYKTFMVVQAVVSKKY